MSEPYQTYEFSDNDEALESMKKIAKKWKSSESSIKGPNDPIDICLMHVVPVFNNELAEAQEETYND
jgi:hypothetical protein